MSKYKVALVGCGKRGGYHAEGFNANSDRFELAAVCDVDAGKLKDFAAQYNIPKTYGDAEEMLAAERPDVFCFATLPGIRLPLIELGVKYATRAIAYEKPIAQELSEARRIHDLCKASGLKVIVSHQQKYGPHWQKTKEIVDSGDIGEVQRIHATARSWISQLGTHLMDYMLWFNNRSPIEWVVGQNIGTQMLGDSHPSPDFTLGAIQYANGVRGIIECGAHAPRMNPGDNALLSLPFWTDSSVTVYGTHGYTQVVSGNGWRAMTKSSKGELLSGGGHFDPSYEQKPYLKDLADWLDGKIATHPCDGDISYHGFEGAMALFLSSLESRRVTLPLETIPDDSLIQRFRDTLPVSEEYRGQ